MKNYHEKNYLKINNTGFAHIAVLVIVIVGVIGVGALTYVKLAAKHNGTESAAAATDVETKTSQNGHEYTANIPADLVEDSKQESFLSSFSDSADYSVKYYSKASPDPTKVNLDLTIISQPLSDWNNIKQAGVTHEEDVTESYDGSVSEASALLALSELNATVTSKQEITIPGVNLPAYMARATWGGADVTELSVLTDDNYVIDLQFLTASNMYATNADEIQQIIHSLTVH